MPISLPTNITQMLRMWPGPTAIATKVADQTALIVKMERRDAQSAHRPGVPVAFQSMLGLYPDAGAVIRLALEIRDQPDRPLKLDTFLNPAQTADLMLLRQLTMQPTLDIHIFDMRIYYQYTKRIPFRETARGELASLIDHALALLNEIPPEKRDFGKARDQMIAELS